MDAPHINVLLIEDNSGDANLIKEFLDDGYGIAFEMEWSNRLVAGLERLGRGGVDVALLDLDLPDSQGLETFRLARRCAPEVPIVILSGLNDQPLALQALREGAQDYLVKGASGTEVLVRALRYAIERKKEEMALRDSEQRYKHLLASVTDYIYSVQLNEEGQPCFTAHGPGCANVTGYTSKEFDADASLWYRMIVADDRPAVLAQAAKVMAGDQVLPLEHRIIQKNGSIRWIRNTSVPHLDERRRVISYDGLISDITERKRYEEALAASEERYRVLFERNLGGILVTTMAGEILDCNESFARILGYDSPEKLRHHQVQDFYFDPADRLALLAAVREQRALTNHEICFRGRHGSPVWVLANLSLIDGERRQPLLHGTVIDITERKRAEQAVKESEALYHSLVENSPLYVFRKDREGRFTFANQRFCDSLRKPLEQIIGKTDLDFYPKDLAEKYQQDDHRVLVNREVMETMETYQKPSGERGYVSVVKTPVFDAGRSIVGTQGIFWDVTERKWAEEQKKQLGMARAIQQKLLPRQVPQIDGFEIGGISFPAEATGGDYFDYVTLPDGILGIAVADVSGHGFGPALLAAATHACLRTLANTRKDFTIDEMLASVNRVLFEATEGEPFVTLIFACLDPITRTLVYSNGGHPPAFVLDANGDLKTRLYCTGCFLGISSEADFPIAEPLPLAEGDLILFVTDGILEAMSPTETLFGKKRVLEVVRANRHRSAHEIVQSLCDAARDFYEGEPPHDDITAVVIKVGACP